MGVYTCMLSLSLSLSLSHDENHNKLQQSIKTVWQENSSSCRALDIFHSVSEKETGTMSAPPGRQFSWPSWPCKARKVCLLPKARLAPPPLPCTKEAIYRGAVDRQP